MDHDSWMSRCRWRSCLRELETGAAADGGGGARSSAGAGGVGRSDVVVCPRVSDLDILRPTSAG